MYGQVSAPGGAPVTYGYPGYPPNMNQYHFGPYNHAYYGAHKIPSSGPYMMTHPMYPYPVMMPPGQQPPAGEGDQQQPPQPPYPYPPHMMAHPYGVPAPPPPTTTTATTTKSAETGSESISQRSSPHPETESKDLAKPQPMTPVPSSSSSSNSTSSPGPNETDDPSSRLTDLCSAALNQDHPAASVATD